MMGLMDRGYSTNLTQDEIKEIADRLDNCLGNNFHELCVDIIGDKEVEDNDVYKIKLELANGYLDEYKQYYDNKHG